MPILYILAMLITATAAILSPLFFFVIIKKGIVQIIALNKGKMSWQDIKKFNWLELLFIIVVPISGFILVYTNPWQGLIPFNERYAPSVIFIYTVSALCFYLSKNAKHGNNIFVYWLLRAGIIQGISFCLLIQIHFQHLSIIGLFIPIINLLILGPLMATPYFIKELYRGRIAFLDILEQEGQKTNLATALLSSQLKAPAWQRVLLLFSTILPLLASEEIIIILSGQPPLSLYMAIHETHNFLFSTCCN